MRIRALLFLLLVTVTSACATRAPVRPVGKSTPDPSAVTLFNSITQECRRVRTLTTEIALSGRAGSSRLRARLHGGFATPQSLRLEAVAPFGPPVFILAARANNATVYFPRENRVLPSTPVASVLQRLTGLDIGADDLRLMLSGCLDVAPTVTNGQAWSGGWQAVDLGRNRKALMRTIRGQTVVAAAEFGAWSVDYSGHQDGWPRVVRIRGSKESRVDLIARLAQLSVNTDLTDAAFTVQVPANAERVTLGYIDSVVSLRETK
jgi:outer membrane biogenesis lipoprotein LolB